MLSNKFEERVFEFLKPFYELKFCDNFPYIKYLGRLERTQRNTLFTDVPTNKGNYTEFVFANSKYSIRIECKFQKNKGNIQRNSILGNLHDIVPNIPEKEMIFILNGDGFNLNQIEKLKNKLPMNTKLFFFDEFKKYFTKLMEG